MPLAACSGGSGGSGSSGSGSTSSGSGSTGSGSSGSANSGSSGDATGVGATQPDSGSCTSSDAGTGLFVDDEHPAVYGRVEADPHGGLHVTYDDDTSGGSHVGRYGECASGCDNAASWAFIDLGFGGPFQLDTQGRPRQLTVSGDAGNVVVYEECSQPNCAAASSWNSATIPGTARGTIQDTGFALTPQGGAAFAFVGSQTAPGQDTLSYATCSSNCTTPGNWQVSSLGVPWSDLSPSPAFQLAFDTQGRAHLLYHAANGVLTYAECAAGCGAISAWHQATLATGVSDVPQPHFAFALNPQGRPRVALHTSNQTTFSWCDANDCTSAANWQEAPIGNEPSDALAMALDGQGKPHVAYYDSSAAGVHYKSCPAGCDPHSGWSAAWLADTDIGAADKLPGDPGCVNSNGWTESGSPNISIAIDPMGRPLIALDVVSLESCPSSGVQSKGHAVFLRMPAAGCGSQ